MAKKLTYQYRRARVSMQLLLAAVLAAAFAAGTLPAAQDVWTGLVSGTSSWALLVLGPWIIHQVLFWVVCPAYHYVDMTGRPHFIAKHKIQQGPPKQPTMRQTMKLLAWNQLLWAPVMLVLMTAALMARGWTEQGLFWEMLGQPASGGVFPGLPQLVAELSLLGASALVIFYSTHRFLHRPWWMKKVLSAIPLSTRTISKHTTDCRQHMSFHGRSFGWGLL